MKQDEFSLPSDHSVSMPEWMRFVRRVGAGLLLGGMLGLIYMGFVTYLEPKTYTSSVLVRFHSQVHEPHLAGSRALPQEEFISECHALTSGLNLRGVAKALQLVDEWNTVEQDVLTTLKKNIRVEPLDGSHVVKITAKANQPEQARDIAQCVIDQYKERRRANYAEELKTSIASLNEAIDEQDADVRRACKDYQQAASALKTANADNILHGLTLRLAEDAYERSYATLDEMKTRISTMQRHIHHTPSFLSIIESPLIAHEPAHPNVEENLLTGLRNGVITGLAAALLYQLVLASRRFAA